MYRWTATYFDGASAQSHPITIGSTAEGIAFAFADGTVRQWRSKDYRLEVAPGRSHIRFERQPYRGEAVEVADPAAVSAMLAGTSLGVSKQSHLWILAALCLAGLTGVYLAIPFVTAGIARLMPRGIEERLGRVVVAGLVPQDEIVKNPELDRLSSSITNRVFAAASSEWKYDVTWQRTHEVNALAAPGGKLVVYCGLVQAMRSPEELAAIIAHEATHVSERHSTRNLVRTMGARMLLSLFGGADILVDGAAMLGALHYMRADEEAADEGGQAVLVRAGIDPSAMERAFLRLEKTGLNVPAYLSTHPATKDRQKRAADFARSTPVEARRPLVSESDWQNLRSACPTH